MDLSKFPPCPYCGEPLQRNPTRKTKCVHCGGFVYVKYTPDNPEQRLMTQAQADEAERLWAAHWQRAGAINALAVYGIAADQLDQAITMHGGDIRGAVKHFVCDFAATGDSYSIHLMQGYSESGEEARKWQLLGLERALADLRRANVRWARIEGAPVLADKPSCDACFPLHGSVVSTDARARAIVPSICPKHPENVCLVRLIGLMPDTRPIPT